MDNPEDFEDDDDAEINAPLDVRFVLAGLSMMITSLILLAFSEAEWIRITGAVLFFISFFVMVKKDKRNKLQ